MASSTSMHTEFQEQRGQWQALYKQWSSAPPKPAEGITLGEGALPQLASKISMAYTAGATAGMTKTRFTLPRVDGDDGTADFVLNTAATCGMLYVAQTVSSTAKDEKAPRVSEPEYYKGTLSDFPIFQVQLQIVFQSDPTRFATHKAMILYAAGRARINTRKKGTRYSIEVQVSELLYCQGLQGLVKDV